MFLLIICYVAFSTAKCDSTQTKTLSAFLRQFRAPQPMSIFYNSPKETKTTIIKSMSDQGVALDWNEELQFSKNFLLSWVFLFNKHSKESTMKRLKSELHM